MGIPQKIYIRLAVFIFIFFAAMAGIVGAEVRHQAKELFWIDVPEDWQWLEDRDGVTLTSPNGRPSARIDFVSTDGVTNAREARELLRGAMAQRVDEVATRNGKPILKVERRLGGVFALQTGFIISTPDGMRQSTAIVFFHEGYLFNIYFEAWREFQRLEMEKIVDTMVFEAPKEKEPEPEPAAEASSIAEPQAEKAPVEESP